MTRQNEPPAAWRLVADFGNYHDAMQALLAAQASGPEFVLFVAIGQDGSRAWSEADDEALDDFLVRIGVA